MKKKLFRERRYSFDFIKNEETGEIELQVTETVPVEEEKPVKRGRKNAKSNK